MRKNFGRRERMAETSSWRPLSSLYFSPFLHTHIYIYAHLPQSPSSPPFLLLFSLLLTPLWLLRGKE
jgi:hypothetical protein